MFLDDFIFFCQPMLFIQDHQANQAKHEYFFSLRYEINFRQAFFFILNHH